VIKNANATIIDFRTSRAFCERTTLPLLEKIMGAFEDEMKEKTGYTDYKRPTEPLINEYSYGSVTISVKTVPLKKRPAWKKVLEQTEFWLKFIRKDYSDEIKRKGVITIDSKPYLSLDMTIAQIQDSVRENQEGKEGINQEVNFNVPPHTIPEGLERITYEEDQDYAATTEENALNYARAVIFDKNLRESFYKPFREMLKKRTGYDRDNMPLKTTVTYVRLGNFLFPVQVIPGSLMEYEPIMSSLIKETPSGKITKTTGELIRLREGRGESIDELKTRYDLKKDNSLLYISLDALENRMADLKIENTKSKLTYNISPAIRLD
jgi:hypothetical protein